MKIVFILNSYGKTRYDKRINEFISRGYIVEVFAFKRSRDESYHAPFPAEILNTFDNSLSYIKRSKLIYSGVKKTLAHYHGQKVIYYLFGLDVAMMFFLQRKNEHYIYEEGDLVHTYIGNSIIRNAFEAIDKKIIKKSDLTVVVTGGFLDYHFGKSLDNCVVVPNKLDSSVLELPDVNHNRKLDINHLHIGFVGAPRFQSIYNFFDFACKSFPQHKFHIFGAPIPADFNKLQKYPNIIFHGAFSSPRDLPNIYSQINILVSTYGNDSINVRCSDPNKFYEAIYFKTPIIVSERTYLAKKVNRMGVGYCLDVTEENVVALIKGLRAEKINEIIENIEKIPKTYAVNQNDQLFDKIDKIITAL